MVAGFVELSGILEEFGRRDVAVVVVRVVDVAEDADRTGLRVDDVVPRGIDPLVVDVPVGVVPDILLAAGRVTGAIEEVHVEPLRIDGHGAHVARLVVDASGDHLVDVVVVRVVHETVRDVFQSVLAPGLPVDRRSEVRHREAGEAGALGIGEDVHSGDGIRAVGCRGRADGQPRRDRELGVAGHRGTCRIEADRSEVSTHGGHGVAQGDGTSRSEIFVLAEREPVVDRLRAGVEGGQ